MIALVTDSGSQIPAGLRDRFGVRVVPMVVVIDGEAHREGVDLMPDEFYRRLAAGSEVSTATPSPGDVLAVYEAAALAGATQILSVHTGSEVSAVLGSVKLATGASPVPVEVVDTHTASFAVACCVWAAGDVLAAGGDAVTAAEAARAAASTVGNVFIVGALDLARRGGRLDKSVRGGGGLPVLALADGRMQEVARAHGVEEAIGVMTDHVVAVAADRAQRVGVGDARVPGLAAALAARLRARPEVAELVRYEVGPSVGAHTGPGTVGACFFPAVP